MKHKAFLISGAVWLLALCLCLTLRVSADAPAESAAAELPEGAVWCFSREELSQRPELEGVLITAVPETTQASLRLGERTLLPGDAVSRRDLSRMTLTPAADGEAALGYIPLEAGHLGAETTQTFHLERVEDQPPVALAGELETWRNLPNTGKLRAENDDEGPLTFHLENRPRRGSVELSPDGSYTYTPGKNKVGEDSFTFTVTDQAGRSSAPATVRVTIRKPTDAQTYADLDRDAQFTALWLRETGLFGGELVSERLSFGPERSVSRGEFLAMLMDLRGIDPEVGLQRSGFVDEAEAAAWVRPYLASALRRGIVRGYPSQEGLVFLPNQPITQAEAALMVSRALGLEELQPAAALEGEKGLPAWVGGAGAALAAAGIDFAPAAEPLTRQQAADLLYQVSTK